MELSCRRSGMQDQPPEKQAVDKIVIRAFEKPWRFRTKSSTLRVLSKADSPISMPLLSKSPCPNTRISTLRHFSCATLHSLVTLSMKAFLSDIPSTRLGTCFELPSKKVFRISALRTSFRSLTGFPCRYRSYWLTHFGRSRQ